MRSLFEFYLQCRCAWNAKPLWGEESRRCALAVDWEQGIGAPASVLDFHVSKARPGPPGLFFELTGIGPNGGVKPVLGEAASGHFRFIGWMEAILNRHVR
jgi:hypothetical protein